MRKNHANIEDVIIAGIGQTGVDQGAEVGEMKPSGKAAQELMPTIVAGMQPDDDLGEQRCSGLRVRCGKSGVKAFLYR